MPEIGFQELPAHDLPSHEAEGRTHIPRASRIVSALDVSVVVIEQGDGAQQPRHRSRASWEANT
jgi:hypothetical protein